MSRFSLPREFRVKYPAKFGLAPILSVSIEQDCAWCGVPTEFEITFIRPNAQIATEALRRFVEGVVQEVLRIHFRGPTILEVEPYLTVAKFEAFCQKMIIQADYVDFRDLRTMQVLLFCARTTATSLEPALECLRRRRFAPEAIRVD